MENMPVYTNNYQYQAITYFLRVAEVLEPQLTKDIDEIIPIYTKAERLNEKLRNTKHSFIDTWDMLEKVKTQENSYLRPLKEALINWARKYNLVDDSLENKTYLEIGLWAIPSKRDHPKGVQEWVQFFKKLGREMPECLLHWSIAESVYTEDEEDVAKNRNDNQIFTGKEYPFVFTPGYQANKNNLMSVPVSAYNFETIYTNYEYDVFNALEGKKENIKGFTLGYAWDPRNESWREFEQKLDAAYKQYKDLYKVRTESLMKKLGYIEGKEKRNKEHFEWLVRFQLQGRSIKDIADEYSKEEKTLSEDTIKKALAGTADIVGLKLRK